MGSTADSFIFFKGSQPRVVKKRTPRIPVSYSCKKNARVNYTVLIKERESEVDGNDDEVTHVAALALTEVSHKAGSLQVSLTPYKRTEHVLSSPAQSWEKTVFGVHINLVMSSIISQLKYCSIIRGMFFSCTFD